MQVSSLEFALYEVCHFYLALNKALYQFGYENCNAKTKLQLYYPPIALLH